MPPTRWHALIGGVVTKDTNGKVSLIMQISRNYRFPGTPFTLREEILPAPAGRWGSTKLTVFKNTVECGSYIRNYPSMGVETFYPFKSASGQWYALYSAHYTALRVLRITDAGLEDWCGEDPSAHGFCPGELYIPQYVMSDEILIVDNEYDDYSDFEKQLTMPSDQIRYAEFGFIAGCVWGDDNLFKLRHIDLSKVDDKIITVDDRYGYHELPDNVPLKRCIAFVDSLGYANIATVKTLKTGVVGVDQSTDDSDGG